MTDPTPDRQYPDIQPNTVELVGHYGGDQAHALSAWTSTYRDLTEERRLRLPTFLKSLADNGHHTPFEKSCLHFLCRTDIATHIHLLKHRIGVSVNSESARYKEIPHPTFYIPEDWSETSQAEARVLFGDAEAVYRNILRREEDRLGRKRAKESARFVFPYSHQYTVDVMFNFRSFAHFCGLRAKVTAQDEVRWVAEEMIRQVKGIDGNPFRFSLKAFAGRSFPVRLAAE